jgi:hypothetical protein
MRFCWRGELLIALDCMNLHAWNAGPRAADMV